MKALIENCSFGYMFAQLWKNISKLRRKQLAILACIMLLASLAEVVSIGALLPFLGVLMAPERLFSDDRLQPMIELLGVTEGNDLLLPLTVIFVFAALFSGAMRLILLWGQTRLGFAIGADFSFKMYKNILYQPYSIHISRNSSEVISGVSSKANSVVNYILLPVLYIISSVLILLAIMSALIIIDPVVALIVFSSFGVMYSLILFSTKRRLAYDGSRVNLESIQVLKALQEALGGIRDVLIDGTQAIYCKIYRDADLPLRRSQANIQIISSSPRFLIESFGTALIAILAYKLVRLETGVAGTIPLLGVLALGAQRLLPVLQLIYWSVSNIRGHQSTLKEVVDFLNQSSSQELDLASVGHIKFNERIRLTNVNFNYSETSPLVLKNINLEIPKGIRIGFMGSTGSGKSTILDLIMGLLQPSKGNLEIDGILISAKNCQSWQRHIAHVPQTIFLADATIAENIAFGIPADNIDHQRVKQSARQAQIAQTIESLDKQYDTFVGERGILLSGGQRQRIGIARALYKQADVIILDEATSALDNETERTVMESIDLMGSKITIIMVAHRLTTLKNCDNVIELENGRIIRMGTYSEMISKSKKQKSRGHNVV